MERRAEEDAGRQDQSQGLGFKRGMGGHLLANGRGKRGGLLEKAAAVAGSTTKQTIKRTAADLRMVLCIKTWIFCISAKGPGKELDHAARPKAR